ncbi:TetR/AcrR family transcriptional regulator [Acerihabitans sp. TG2]|uniref:TetR/AcrR family transcriptional regulator n=1 Tax=Acerihabitans sp. TG2 TaxID=3096008 RepID=UPI002B2256FD|nr:TetR/AcrR family transcriptional regulator [Acerihabitans sp. TG2]MEA9391404.1 TetR/AcrR family transcriptional regulator [Acerihabitans sp. TG2]
MKPNEVKVKDTVKNDKKLQSDVANTLQDTALELFAGQNYSSVRIKDIAEATGLNSALIYYYFGSKENLFLKVIESTVEKAFEQFDSIKMNSSHPKDVLFLWIQIHILQFYLLQKLAKISLDYASTNGRTPAIDKAIKKFYEKESVVLKNTITDGITAGVFREVNPVDMAMFISTFLDGVLFRTVMFPKFRYKHAINCMREFVFEHLDIKHP